MAAAQEAPAATEAPGVPAATDGAAAAQEEEAEPADVGEDIVVTGQRPRGSVPGDIPPEQTLNPADIRSYGVSSIGDLLTELAPQTTSGRGGAPVVLLNGRRISGFREIRDIPTEAILRVEVLPEEVALKFGYRADQKVVNFVLRRRFRSVAVELADAQATEGGRNTPAGKLDLLNIQAATRLTLHGEYQRSSALTEDERTIPLNGSGTPDQRAFRTLLGQAESFSANAVYSRNVFGNVAATVNGSVERTNGLGLNGLPIITPGVIDLAALEQRNSAWTTHLGTTFNGDVGTWRWSLTGNYDRVDSKSVNEAQRDTDTTIFANRGRSTSSTGNVDLLFAGTAFTLPAGAVATSVRVGASTSDFDSRADRFGDTQRGQVSRDIVNGQLNVDLPLTSRSRDVLGAIGNLSANLNLGLDQLSDFGTLTTLGYGLNWSPIPALRLLASFTDEKQAPTAQQLGDPYIATPNVRVFDFVTGQNAIVTRITGGNPLLDANTRHVMSFSGTLKPWSAKDIAFTANYTKTRIDDPIASFPGATAAIEQAFPQRFLRDSAGQLLQIDSRPINFAESDRSQLRWGVNFSQPLKSRVQKQLEAFRAGTGPNPFEGVERPGGRRGAGATPGDRPPGEGGARAAGGDRPGGEGRRGGFGGGGRGGGGGGGRLNFAVYHTWHLTDRVTVADGGPTLDLLRGDTLGSGGGQSRHEVELQAGYSNNGLGARLSGNWMSATEVNGGTLAAPETLNFGSLATVNLRLFADLSQRRDWVKDHPWMRGLRVTLSIDNIANSRQRVTDAGGVTPFAYAPDYIDPLGRTVRLSVRKLFF
ncbi:TonB-dependent receptor [Sphingomonas hylomeconis]|uniref:TonB-dependent receptor n=1 Tax=Sphingomonas hylomeconis TaxID=1395958 RepID=A0ABV7STA0_9SPHN|nr:TonB-dependent receptor [Sphingomonas hylomeconis]